jgi:hypothetical protein
MSEALRRDPAPFQIGDYVKLQTKNRPINAEQTMFLPGRNFRFERLCLVNKSYFPSAVILQYCMGSQEDMQH